MNLENNCDHDWMNITCVGNDERKFICNGCSMTKSVPYGWEEMTWNDGDEGISMNLIEELGLENAKALDVMLQKHAVPESWKIAVINGMWQRSSVGFTHGDLRTAIAEHDALVNKGTSITDRCTDIRNHISPTTVVIER